LELPQRPTPPPRATTRRRWAATGDADRKVGPPGFVATTMRREGIGPRRVGEVREGIGEE
jgi:hypothetical protein